MVCETGEEVGVGGGELGFGVLEGGGVGGCDGVWGGVLGMFIASYIGDTYDMI